MTSLFKFGERSGREFMHCSFFTAQLVTKIGTTSKRSEKTHGRWVPQGLSPCAKARRSVSSSHATGNREGPRMPHNRQTLRTIKKASGTKRWGTGFILDIFGEGHRKGSSFRDKNYPG
jgi:hypothetical protein